MKIYNIEPTEVSISTYTIHALALGEKGRGRTQTIVPTPDLSVGRGVRYLEPGVTKAGKPRLNQSNNPNGWVARISTEGAYIRGACGNVSVHRDFPFQLIAKGHGAFGAAGGTGTWDDVLITLHNFALVRVKPSRGDAYFLWFSPQGVNKLTLADIEALGDVDEKLPTQYDREQFIRV